MREKYSALLRLFVIVEFALIKINTRVSQWHLQLKFDMHGRIVYFDAKLILPELQFISKEI